MKSISIAAVVALLCLLGADAASDWQPLFNGKDLDGWNVPDPNPWWAAQDGVLVGQSEPKLKGHVLETRRLYKDFVLETDVRFGDGIDSGIFLRSPALQVQIGVSRSLKRDMTCSIYVDKGGYVAKAHDVDKLLKLNEWNTIRVEARGPKFNVALNGQAVLEYQSDKYPNPGPIGLQIHPGVKMKVEFRNMRIRDLDGAP
jgi:hypothetical protein